MERKEGSRILIVEDEMMVTMLLRTIVSDLGYNVVAVVSSEKDALDVIENQTVDVAILDVNLGGQNSYGVADALVRHQIPAIISTGYPENTLERPYRELPVVSKPFRISELERTLSTVLATSETQ